MKGLLKYSIFAVLVLYTTITNSQIYRDSELFKILKQQDSLLFSSVFNECKTEDMASILSEDLEFYHDTGGITLGKDTFLKSIEQNICKNRNIIPYKKLDLDSLKVYTLAKDGVLYGAIQKGDHRFYLRENGEVRPTVRAKFTHLWILENKKWMLKRVFSYHHQPIQH